MNNITFNSKEIILKNIEENLLTVKYINNYNSSIQQNSINEVFPFLNPPFTFNENKNTIIVDNLKIKNVKTLGHEPLLTLLSVKLNIEDSEHKNKLYHLLSYSVIDNKFYINFYLLQHISFVFNEHYYDVLFNMKNNNDLKNIIITLLKGFSFKDDTFKLDEKSSLEKLFKELYSYLKHKIKEEVLEVQEKIYYFNVIDLNLFKNIKKDLMSIEDNNTSSLANFIYMKNNIEKDKNQSSTLSGFQIPFAPEYKKPENEEKQKKKLTLTEHQILVLNGLKWSINYILGVAGSGKTFLLSNYFSHFKQWNAFSVANSLMPIPILYASYSNSTNSIFYKHMETLNENKFIEPNKIFNYLDLVFYIERNGEDSINLNKNTVNSIKKRINVKREHLNINRLLDTQTKLKTHTNIQEFKFKFETLFNFIQGLENYKTMFSLEEKKLLRQVLINIKSYMDGQTSFLKKIFGFLLKNEDFVFSNDEEKLLRKNYPYLNKRLNSKEPKDVEFLTKLFTKIKNILTDKNVFNLFDNFDDKKFNTQNFNISSLNISDDDYYYYLLFHYFIDNDDTKILFYQNTLKKLITPDQPLNKEEIECLKLLFPLHISNISDLSYFIPTEFNYYMTLIDESLLIPNYLTYSVLGRTSFITVVGDVSQMSFYHLLPKNTLSLDTERIYGKLKNNFSMYLNEQNNKINSFYDIVSYKKTFKDNPNFKLLYSNFRYNRNIYEALFKLSDEYMSYVSGDVWYSLESQINSLIPFYWEFVEGVVKPINSNLFFLENDLYSKTETYKRIFRNIKVKNNFEEFRDYKTNQKLSLAILTPFSSDKKDIQMIIRNLQNNSKELFEHNGKKLYDDISILSVYEVQGMEFDVVIYDSFLDKNLKEYENILTNKPQILTVAISRSKSVFFLVGKKDKFYSTESEIHKNIREVVKDKFFYIE